MTYCKSCKYHSPRTKTCDYLLKTHRLPERNGGVCKSHAPKEDKPPKPPLPSPNTYQLYRELGSTAGAVNKLTKGQKP